MNKKIKKSRMIYLSENKNMSDFGFGFNDDSVVKLNDEEHIDKKKLYQLCIEACPKDNKDRLSLDFRLAYNESGEQVIFRGRKIITSIGVVFGLREIFKGVPNLKNEALQIPEFYKELASAPFLLKGGLVIVSGMTGHGKSTTLTATLVNRLMLYGGIGLSIEDPPEYQMTGKIGKGVCFQIPVCHENGGTFAEAIKGALRFYPAGESSTILSIGEIRDSETAAHVLRESINGHLVMATIHSKDIEGALSRLLTLASQEIGLEDAQDLLGQSLRMSVHQKIIGGKPKISVLVNDGSHNLVSAKIRGGEIHSLNSEIMRQNNLIRKQRILPLEGK